VLTGVLMTDAVPPQPVRRATIRLAVQSGVGTRLAGTDDEGKFRFDALPAGSYTLSATKPGYVQTFHGSKHPGRGPGVPVALADGQQVSVTLRIVPGAVITGTITDSRGNPAPNVQVAVIAVSAGGTSNTPVRGSTDDRGMYRVFGLAPGDYLVSALPPDLGTGVGYGRGQVPNILGVTDAEVKWARSQSATGTAPMPSPGKTVTYAAVFHPGTTDVSAAMPVSVAVGEEREGIGFALQVVPASRIAGTIIDANGQPVTVATVALYPRRRDQVSPADAFVSSGAVTLPRAVVSATGFSITGVAPGEYTMVARSGSGSRGAQPPPTTPVLWSVTDLTVDGSDQSDLVLRLMPGLKLSGTIVFEHTSLAPPADMSAIDLSLQASGSSLGTASTPRATVASNGTFTFSGIAPWIYTITATPPGAATGARWMLKSAVLNGRDLADSAFEVKPGSDVTGLAITFTDRAAEISGRLVDPGGRPITRYSIVVFPAERALWLPGSRRIRSARPATDGSFTVAGLPAGAYAIAAAEDVEAADLSDPAFLVQLLASAYKVTLADGEQKKQDLRAGG
jgi:carboxypeptidase family protein